MALISILAAGLAFRTSLLGSEAARLDGVALEESVERQRRELFAALVIDHDSRLFATYAQIHADMSEQRAASANAANDTDVKASINLRIQADSELLRAMFPMFQAAQPSTVDGVLRFDGPGRLASWLATDPRLQELRAGIAAARAEDLEAATLTLIGEVALLVAALFLLTVAQVSRRRIASVAAAGAAVLTIGILLAIGLAEEVAFLQLFMLALAALFVPAAIALEVAVIRGTPRTTAGDDHVATDEESPDHIAAAAETVSRSRGSIEHLPTPEPSLRDPAELATPARRFLAVIIACATLVAAGTGWLQAQAFHEADNAAERSRGHTLMATSLAHARVGEAEQHVERLVRYVMARVNAANANHEAEWYEALKRTVEAANSRRDANHWTSVADADTASAQLLASAAGPRGYGPDSGGDPRFPNVYLLQAQHDALVQLGLSDAENRASAAWSAEGSMYTAALVVLAVALYLLGLAMILRVEGIRRLFTGIAALCIVAIVVGAGLQVLSRLMSPEAGPVRDLAAAEHFAAGDVALSRAATATDFAAMLETAQREFEAAIVIRPDFALARQDLATVHILRGTPETSAAYPSIIDAEACQAADKEIAELRELQVDSALAEWNLAYCHYREGLLLSDRGLLEAAEMELSNAIERLPAQGILYANLGVTRLALGNLDSARRAYADGIAAMRFLQDGKTPLDPLQREFVVAAALTELTTLGGKRLELKTVADELKQFVVHSTMASRSPTPIEIRDVELLAAGSQLYWRAHLTGSEVADATVSVQYYRLDPERNEWYVLPTASGDASGRGDTYYAFGHASSEDETLYAGQVVLLGLPLPECVSGRYRVEIYTGSAFASAEIEVDGRDVVAEVDRLLHVGFCRPRDWTLASAGAGDHATFRSADGRRGITIARAHPAFASQDLLEVHARTLAIVRNELFPGVLEPVEDAFGSEWYRLRDVYGMPGMDGYMRTIDGQTLVFLQLAIDASGSLLVVAIHGPQADFTAEGKGGFATANSFVVFP